MEKIEKDHIKLRKEFVWKYTAFSKRRLEIYERDNYKCLYCGITVITLSDFFDLVDNRQKEEFEKVEKKLITFEEFNLFDPRKEIETADWYKSQRATLDHKIPLSKGGTNDPENLTTSCYSCNVKKGRKIHLDGGYTRIANALLEKFATVQMSGSCWQVLIVILRKTYGFGKNEDWIEYSQITKLCNLPKSRISHSIKQLREYGIVTQKRNGIKQIIGINKDFQSVVKNRNSSTKNQNSQNRSAKVEPTVTVLRTTKETLQKKKTIQKKTSDSARAPSIIALMIEVFKQTNPTLQYGNKSERSACERIVKEIGEDAALAACKAAVRVQGDKYAPIITKPTELERNIGKLRAHVLRQKKPTNKRLTL